MPTTPIPTETTISDNQPLPIRITAGGREVLVLRALVRQALPMLRNPHSYRTEQRLRLAQLLARVLEGEYLPDARFEPPFPDDADAPCEDLDDLPYEPGCFAEEPES